MRPDTMSIRISMNGEFCYIGLSADHSLNPTPGVLDNGVCLNPDNACVRLEMTDRIGVCLNDGRELCGVRRTSVARAPTRPGYPEVRPVLRFIADRPAGG